MTDDAPPSAVVKEVLVGGEMGFDLGFNSLREQALRACAQNVLERVQRLGSGLIDRNHGWV